MPAVLPHMKQESEAHPLVRLPKGASHRCDSGNKSREAIGDINVLKWSRVLEEHPDPQSRIPSHPWWLYCKIHCPYTEGAGKENTFICKMRLDFR